jgi:predicted nucleic acid-binding protein
MNVYLDTSAVIKLYYREVGSEELLAFLRRHSDNLIITMADITRTEFQWNHGPKCDVLERSLEAEH